ncbi:MAG: glycosyltransferase family 39 protein [bacterium]
MKKEHLLLFILILIVASAIRFYDPTFRSLWGDESHSLYAALEIFEHNVTASSMGLVNDSHMPVYFLLLSAWIKMFGPGEYALRLLSVIVGIFAVIAFYSFAREMFDEPAALISAFLLTISPLAIMHSQEIRMYGVMLLFTIMSYKYYWRLHSGKIDPFNLTGYFVFTLLLLFTHIYAILVLLAEGLAALYFLLREKNIRQFSIITGMQLLALMLVAPIYARMVICSFSAIVSGSSDMAFQVFPSYIKPFLFFFVLSLGETVAPWNVLIVLPIGFIFGGLFIRSFKYISDGRVVFLMTLILFPVLFAAFFLRPTMPKYLIPCLPAYLLLFGYSLSRVERRGMRYALLMMIAVFQVMAISNYFSLREYHNSNQIEPWRKVAALIKKEYRKGDFIVTSNQSIVHRLLNYYFNIQDGRHLKLYCLSKGHKDSINVADIKGRRIWLVTHILDDRAFPEGYIEKIRMQMGGKYRIVLDEKFIKYEETLVSKIPINRHKPGSCRIRASLYLRNE